MELLTTSILTLILLYVIYSETFKLPSIIKKNKNLSYIIIISLYLYYYHNNYVEGLGPFSSIILIILWLFLVAMTLDLIKSYPFKYSKIFIY